MALRLSADLSKKGSGFDIKFTEGITYNLEDIIANSNRTDSEKALIIEIKKSKVISEKVANLIKRDLEANLISSLYKSEIQEHIVKVIKETFYKYGCNYSNISQKAAAEINYNINRYLRELSGEEDIKYNVKFSNMQGSVEISYSFASSEILNNYFLDYYRKYIMGSEDALSVSEGGLAISDRKGKVRINSSDYSKYLIEKDSKTYTGDPSTWGVSPSKVKVRWEEGTPDTTLPSQVDAIYEEIEELEETIKDLNKQLEEEKVDIEVRDGIFYIDTKNDNVTMQDGVLFID